MDFHPKKNLSYPLPPKGKDYQAVVRTFPNGMAEVSTKAVRSLDRMQFSESWQRFNPISMKPKPELTESEKAQKAEDNRKRAIRRARQQVRWAVKAIGADHMLTLNYRENMQDLHRLKRDWQEFVRLVRLKYPDWLYVAIREYQERGALHLHVAVVGRQDIKYLRRCWYKTLGASMEAKGEDTPGQINVRAPMKRWGGNGYIWRPDKLAGYMTKYLHKMFEVHEKGSKHYWTAKNITVEAKRIWLGATNFIEAIVETHDLIRGLGCPHISMWASEGYESIWISGA